MNPEQTTNIFLGIRSKVQETTQWCIECQIQYSMAKTDGIKSWNLKNKLPRDRIR